MRSERVFGAGERTATQSNKNNMGEGRGQRSVSSRSDEGLWLSCAGEVKAEEVAGGHTDGTVSEELFWE